MKVFHCEGELVGADSETEAREIIANGGFVPGYTPDSSVCEVTGDVMITESGRRTPQRVAASDLVAEGFGGWLCAGDPT